MRILKIMGVIAGLLLAILAVNTIGTLMEQKELVEKGFYVTENPYEVAKIAAQKGDVHECNNIRVPYSLTQTQESAVSTCIYNAASLLRDPRACELLMPSSYGISCIENILPPIDGPSLGYNCGTNDISFYCYSRIPLEKPDIILEFTQCNSYRDQNQKDWCTMGRIMESGKFNDCSGVLLNQDHRDHCQYLVALKANDDTSCQTIVNPIRQSVCKLLVKAQKEHPEIFSEEI